MLIFNFLAQYLENYEILKFKQFQIDWLKNKNVKIAF